MLCFWVIPGSGGYAFNWVVNSTNGHTGFVHDVWLGEKASVECTSYGRGTRVTIRTASLFQCPYENCNQGVANPEDDVTTAC